MAFFDFIIQYKWILLFYATLALIIYFNRKKFQVENKFILLYRTKYGINIIDKFADKYKEFVKVLGYSAIGVGFIGMITIIGFFIKGLYELFFVPSAPPTMSLVIPGVQIPGSPVFIPFWYGIIALFIVVTFHEFGHGIVAKAHGIPIKSTGIVFFGPLIGAFVEPDEKKLTKQASPIQVSMFAAGPFFNAILSAVVMAILLLALNPLMSTMVDPVGVKFATVQEGFPAAEYGIIPNTVYTQFNNQPLKSGEELVTALTCVTPNQNISLGNVNRSVSLITAENPTDKTKGYLGVAGISTEYKMKSEDFWYKGLYNALFLLTSLLEWVFMLSLGIGLANLLPLGPVDGGRMLLTTLTDIKGKDKGTKLWARISWITFIVMIFLLIVPIIRTLLFKA
jgi:membrane-associated protease RseP (regulator of RpoE activity)